MHAFAGFCMRGVVQGAVGGAIFSCVLPEDEDEPNLESIKFGLTLGAIIGLVNRLAVAALFQIAGICGLAGTLGGLAVSAVLVGVGFVISENASLENDAPIAIAYAAGIGLLGEIGIGYVLLGLGQRAITLLA